MCRYLYQECSFDTLSLEESVYTYSQFLIFSFKIGHGLLQARSLTWRCAQGRKLISQNVSMKWL